MAELDIIKLARQRLLDKNRDTISSHRDERLEDFMVRVNPALIRPLHLGSEVLDILNRVKYRDRTRLLWSVPPRHGKSLSVLHLLAQFLSLHPDLRIAYISHGEDLAFEHSRIVRNICVAAGVELSKEVNSARLWATTKGGSFTAAGLGAGIMGKGFDFVVVDDPYGSKNEAESSAERARIQSNFETVLTRINVPKHSAVIVIHTRYSVDDVIGHTVAAELQKPEQVRMGWKYINIPALDEQGRALWPDQWSAEELLRTKAEQGDYYWASMYMGQPRPRGGAVFNDVNYYERLPSEESPKRESIGLDLAYTAKTYSDYSVAVTAKLYGDTVYITNVRRKQSEVRVFANEIRAEKIANPRAIAFWYIGPIERPVGELLRNEGLYIKTETAKGDKFVRAQAVAAAWNNGKVLLPKNAPWLATFLDEVLTFTGKGDVHDDQVDALAAAFHPLANKRAGTRGMGQTRLPIF